MQTHKQIIILTAERMPGFAVAACICQHKAAEHYRRMDIRRVWQKIPAFGSFRHAPVSPDPAALQQPGAAAHKSVLRMGAEKFSLSFQPPGKRDIVRIHSGDIFSPALPDTYVQPCGDPFVFPTSQKPDPVILSGQFQQQLSRFLVRTVVIDEKFQIFQGLIQNGLHCQPHLGKIPGIVYAHDHTDFHTLFHRIPCAFLFKFKCYDIFVIPSEGPSDCRYAADLTGEGRT